MACYALLDRYLPYCHLPITGRLSFTPFFFKDFIYLFTRDTEAETQAEGEAASLEGAGCGTHPETLSWTLGSHPERKADVQLLSHPGVHTPKVFKDLVQVCNATPHPASLSVNASLTV